MGTCRVEGKLVIVPRGLAPQHDSVPPPSWCGCYHQVLVGAFPPSPIQIHIASAPQMPVCVFGIVLSITVSLHCILIPLVVPDSHCMTVIIPFVQFPSESVEPEDQRLFKILGPHLVQHNSLM